MAVDFQACFPQESVVLSFVRRLSDPPRLDIVGADFRSVDEVLINNYVAPDFMVLSKTRLIASIPDQVGTAAITDVAVTSRNLIITPKSLIRFQISRTPGKVSGILRLMQLFIKVLFTTAGTDIFNQKLGGSGLRSLGRNVSDSGAVISNFIVSVDNTQRQIITIQSRQPSIPAEERLLAARVVASKFSLSESALLVSIELTSQAGRSAVANVVA